jgi:hypothetical protein
MTAPYNPRAQQPVRRDLIDARSSAAPAPQGRKTILNDSRSTRARPQG